MLVRKVKWESSVTCRLTGRPIHTPEVLFAKIEDAQVAEWTERFAGASADA